MALLSHRISTKNVIPFSPLGIITNGFNQGVGSLVTYSIFSSACKRSMLSFIYFFLKVKGIFSFYATDVTFSSM